MEFEHYLEQANQDTNRFVMRSLNSVLIMMLVEKE